MHWKMALEDAAGYVYVVILSHSVLITSGKHCLAAVIVGNFFNRCVSCGLKHSRFVGANTS